MQEFIITTPQQIKVYIAEVLQELLTRANLKESGETSKKKYLTFDEAAKYLDVAHSTLYGYNSKKVIPYSNRGRKNYYLQVDLENFISSHRKKTSAELTEQAMAKMRSKKR